MPITKRGIYHNLKESKYTISNSEVVLFFSSKLYLNNFLKRYKENREKFVYRKIESESPFNLSTLADITLYKEIEKRGFRATIKGVEFNWNELHNYALRKMTDEKCLEWKRIKAPKVGERFG